MYGQPRRPRGSGLFNNIKTLKQMDVQKITDEETVELFNGGATMKEIAEDFGLSISVVKNAIRRYRTSHPNEAQYKHRKVEVKVVKEELTPREMIKRLYDLGYRIEDNQLVIYQKQVVKIGDVVNNG